MGYWLTCAKPWKATLVPCKCKFKVLWCNRHPQRGAGLASAPPWKKAMENVPSSGCLVARSPFGYFPHPQGASSCGEWRMELPGRRGSGIKLYQHHPGLRIKPALAEGAEIPPPPAPVPPLWKRHLALVEEDRTPIPMGHVGKQSLTQAGLGLGNFFVIFFSFFLLRLCLAI